MRNIASRTFLRDFVYLLEGFKLYRVHPRGLSPLTYRPACEMFLDEANYAAIKVA